MADIDLTEEQLLVIKQWAHRNQVEAVRLFGSRAKGCSKPESDVDLAVTANAGQYVASATDWEKELSTRLRLTVHIRDFARNKAIRDACEECSIPLYPA